MLRHYLKLCVALALASVAMTEIATLSASFADWRVGEQPSLRLYIAVTTEMATACKGVKCSVTVQACAVDDKFNEIIDIPDECKKYVSNTPKRQLDNELTPAACVQEEVDLNQLLQDRGYCKITGLQGNTVYAVDINEVINGKTGKSKNPYMLQTPSVEGKSVRRTKKGFDLDSHLAEDNTLTVQNKKKQLLIELLKRLLQDQ